MRFVVATIFCLMMSSVVDAGIFGGRFRSNCVGGNCSRPVFINTPESQPSKKVVENNDQDKLDCLCCPTCEPKANEVALQKAKIQASRNSASYPGGNFPGSTAACASGPTYQAAVKNCHFWGEKAPIGIGVSQGANKVWYATVLYR